MGVSKVVRRLSGSSRGLILGGLVSCPIVGNCGRVGTGVGKGTKLTVDLFFPVKFPICLLTACRHGLLQRSVGVMRGADCRLVSVVRGLPMSLWGGGCGWGGV